MAKKILLLSRTRSTRTLLEIGLNQEFEVTAVSNETWAFQAFTTIRPDLVIVDSGPLGSPPIRVLYEFQERHDRPPIILLTEPEQNADSVGAGADKVLVKPVTPEELLAVVRTLL